MQTRRLLLTIAIIVAMFSLYLFVQPLGSGFQALTADSYEATASGVEPDNTWSTFREEGPGAFFVHPGESAPVTATLTFNESIDAHIAFSIQEGGAQAGNIRFTVTHNGNDVASVVATYQQPATITLSVQPFDVVAVEADKNGPTTQDWGQIRIQEKSPWFTLEALLIPGLWALLTFYLASRKHLSVAVNAYLIFLTLVIADKVSFGLLGFRHLYAYSALSMGLAFVFVWIYQELYWARRFRLATVFSFIAAVAVYTIPASYLIYFLTFNESLDKTALFAVFQTNTTEAVDYWNDFISVKWSLVYVGFITLIGVLMLTHEYREEIRLERSLLFFLVGFFAITTASTMAYLRLPGHVYSAATEYHRELSIFRQLQERRNVKPDSFYARAEHNDEVHIVIIGESLNRRHMGLYGYPRATTPMLSEMESRGDIVVYRNAFSNHTHTMPVLSHALTEANQFNGKNYFESASIIEVLKAAGMHTAWLTNQNLLGAWDNMVTVLADSADDVVGVNKAIGETVQTGSMDGDLLPHIAKAIRHRADGNNVIFVHLMGNHNPYCRRFTDDYDIFNGPLSRGVFGHAISEDGPLAGTINCYDNSVLYNDYVVSSIFQELKAYGSVSSAVYIADHADDVIAQRGHNSATFTFEMTSIPLVFWMSDGYRERYPAKSNRLVQGTERFFSNDLLYDTLLGLTGVETDRYESQFDLTHDDYAVDVNQAHTLHGEWRMTAHENHIWWQRDNVRMLQALGQESRVIPHRVNSSGKLHDVWATGYRSFEIDILFEKGDADSDVPDPDGADSGGIDLSGSEIADLELGGAGPADSGRGDSDLFDAGLDDSGVDDTGSFLIGHEIATSGGRFDDFLESVPVDQIQKIWFDLKNLNGSNYQDVLAALERLDSRYAVKDKIILESGTQESWFKVFSDKGWHTSYYAPTDHIIGLLENDNVAGMQELADGMAVQLQAQNVAAVSYDHRVYPFIKQYLEPHLPAAVVYHSWIGPTIANGLFKATLETTPIYTDPRVKTVLVPFESPFHL